MDVAGGYSGATSEHRIAGGGEKAAERKRAAQPRSKFYNRNFGRYWFFSSSTELGKHSAKQPHLCTQAWLFGGRAHLQLLLNTC